MKNPWDNPYVDFAFRDGIVVCTFNNSASPITLEKAVLARNCRLLFQNGIDGPILIKTQGWIVMDNAALKYLGSPEGIVGVKAAALMNDNFLIGTAIAIFLTFVPKSMPVKVVRSEKSAFKWLASYK